MSDNQQTATRRFVVSICGGSGTGKSTLAKLICAMVGDEWATRIPADYYLKPNESLSADEFSHRPFAYDWDLITAALASRDGQSITTPNFDFAHFRRSAADGGKSFVMRPLAIIDAMLPYPWADFVVLLEAPDGERRKRIKARDEIWNTQVLSNWEQHQRTFAFLKSQGYVFDCVLDATQPVEANANRVIALLRGALPFAAVSTTGAE